MKKAWLINLTLLCTILGMLLAWQYNSFKEQTEVENVSLKENMLSMITELELEIQLAETKIRLIRNEISGYHENNLRKADKLEFLQDYLYLQRSMASLTPEKGLGLIITLDDNVTGAQSAISDFSHFRPEDYIIHDKNLLYLVNELKAAGATAIAINNQRIVAYSNIRCVGTVILVNTIPMTPPYNIKVLGNPETIKDHITTGNEIPYLKNRNFPVKIEIVEVEIPEYRGSFRISQLAKVEDSNDK